jgi:hypothetical protein
MSEQKNTPLTDAIAFDNESYETDVHKIFALIEHGQKLERDRSVLLEALKGLVESHDRDQYKSWEKGCPNWHTSVGAARAAIALIESGSKGE